MSSRRRWLIVPIIIAGFGACSDSELGRYGVERASQVSATICSPGESCAVSVPFPAGVPLQEVVLGADGALQLADRVKVQTASSEATLANMGSDETNIGVDAEVTSIVSIGPVTLRQGATVDGDVKTAGSITRQDPVTVTGTQTANTSIATTALSWTTTFPSTNAGNINVEPDQRDQRPPGAYGDVSVKTGATLELEAGTYHFESISLEPDATLELASSTDPVVIYVRSGFTDRGNVVSAGPNTTDLVVIYMGTQPASIERPVEATVVAPNADLTLATTSSPYRGAFFAHRINVQPDVTIVHEPADRLIPLGVDASDPRACALSVPVDNNLSPDEAERQYQRDVYRLCVDPGADVCKASLAANILEDRRAMALQLIHRIASPGQYLALSRDRGRKDRMAELDANYACRVLAGDEDGDLVPSDVDQCPDTPPLTPTDDVGCTDPNVPPGPNADYVDALIHDFGIAADPRCDPGIPLSVPAKPVSITVDDSGTPTVQIILDRVEGQPADCPLFHQVLLHIISNESHYYNFVLREEEGTVVGNNLVFTLDDSDPRSNGDLAQVMLNHIFVEMRTRVTSGAGIRSAWSPALSFFRLQ